MIFSRWLLAIVLSAPLTTEDEVTDDAFEAALKQAVSCGQAMDAKLVTRNVEKITALVDHWLAVQAPTFAHASKPELGREDGLRVGTTLLAALAGAYFEKARPRLDSYRRLSLPLPALAERIARQAPGNRDLAEYFLSDDTPQGLDAYLEMGIVLPQAEPALTRAFAACREPSSQWSQHCSAIHRQLAILDTPGARKAIASVQRPKSASEDSADSYREYQHDRETEHLKLALESFVPAALLSGSGAWQLLAWQTTGSPSAARSPLITINGALTGGAVLSMGLLVATALAIKGDSDTRDGGGAVAALLVGAGLLGAGLGVVGGGIASYQLRDHRSYYRTIAISQIVWPLIAGWLIYDMNAR